MKRMFTRWTGIFERFTGQDSLPISWQRFLLALILLGILLVRLLTLNAPPVDRTAWREIVYVDISVNYWQKGASFLLPEVSWPAEPPRVTPSEFPLIPYMSALLYPVTGFNAFSVRAVTLAAYLLLSFYMFRLAKRELGPLVGILAALAAGVMPLYHEFGRLSLPEPLVIAMSVMALYHLAEWIDFTRVHDGLLFVLAFSLAIALKLESLYILLPIFWLGFRTYKWQLSAYKSIAVLIALGLILPAAWYAYAYSLEASGVQVVSIFEGHNKFQTLRMLTYPGWYRTMGGRVLRDVLGGVAGSLLCLIGLLAAGWRRKAGLFFVYLIAIGAYAIIVAEGHIDAPYRQLTSIPPLAVFVALGAIAIAASALTVDDSLKESSTLTRPRTSALLVIGCILLIIVLPVANYRRVVGYDGPAHPDRWEMAQVIKRVAKEDSKLVTAREYTAHIGGYDISPVLYYYTGLQGWTLLPDEWSVEYVQALVRKGATLFVAMPVYGYDPAINVQDGSIDPFLQDMKANFHTLYESGDVLLLDLQQPEKR